MNGRQIYARLMVQWCILRGYKEKEKPWVSVIYNTEQGAIFSFTRKEINSLKN